MPVTHVKVFRDSRISKVLLLDILGGYIIIIQCIMNYYQSTEGISILFLCVLVLKNVLKLTK